MQCFECQPGAPIGIRAPLQGNRCFKWGAGPGAENATFLEKRFRWEVLHRNLNFKGGIYFWASYGVNHMPGTIFCTPLAGVQVRVRSGVVGS